jgi:hypothetical protein
MMDAGAFQPQLRLVAEDQVAVARWRREQQAAAAVAAENRSASVALSPTDPRWVLAARAYSNLQGPTLTPERRERLMRTAKQLGVRAFDANVIIAIVQDHARRGSGSLHDAAPTLALLSPPEPPAATRSIWTRWLAAVIIAATATVMLILWLVG